MKTVNVDDVLKILHKYGKYIFATDETRYSAMVDEIANLKALRSSENPNKWIPCSERLPEENGRYLVTNSAWGAMDVDWNAWVDGVWLYPNTKPIAWMPLPEPFQAESEAENED